MIFRTTSEPRERRIALSERPNDLVGRIINMLPVADVLTLTRTSRDLRKAALTCLAPKLPNLPNNAGAVAQRLALAHETAAAQLAAQAKKEAARITTAKKWSKAHLGTVAALCGAVVAGAGAATCYTIHGTATYAAIRADAAEGCQAITVEALAACTRRQSDVLLFIELMLFVPPVVAASFFGPLFHKSLARRAAHVVNVGDRFRASVVIWSREVATQGAQVKNHLRASVAKWCRAAAAQVAVVPVFDERLAEGERKIQQLAKLPPRLLGYALAGDEKIAQRLLDWQLPLNLFARHGKPAVTLQEILRAPATVQEKLMALYTPTRTDLASLLRMPERKHLKTWLKARKEAWPAIDALPQAQWFALLRGESADREIFIKLLERAVDAAKIINAPPCSREPASLLHVAASRSGAELFTALIRLGGNVHQCNSIDGLSVWAVARLQRELKAVLSRVLQPSTRNVRPAVTT